MEEPYEVDVYEYTAVVVDTMRECASLLVVLRQMLDILGVGNTERLFDEAVNLVDGARDLERVMLSQQATSD